MHFWPNWSALPNTNKMNEKPRIIVIDDKAQDCETISDILLQNKDQGYEVEIAKSGKEALEKIKGKFFAAALIDIRLPDTNGLELLKEIKIYSPKTEALMITAYTLLEDAVKALNLGAFSYLAKPINMGELLVKIGRALEKQAMDKELQKEIRKLEEKNKEAVERELRIIEMEKEIEALKQEVSHAK